MVASCGCGALGMGVMLGGASIFSIGPSNVMLMREGLVQGRVGLVASSVWVSNLALLTASLVLTDTIARGLPPLRFVMTLLGIATLSWFAVRSFRSARRPSMALLDRSIGTEKTIGCLWRALATVWLNPLFYIELLLVPASVCDGFKDPSLRLQFAVGLAAMITVKVYGYAFAAGSCAPYLKSTRSLQRFDVASGLVQTCVAVLMTARLVVQTV